MPSEIKRLGFVGYNHRCVVGLGTVTAERNITTSTSQFSILYFFAIAASLANRLNRELTTPACVSIVPSCRVALLYNRSNCALKAERAGQDKNSLKSQISIPSWIGEEPQARSNSVNKFIAENGFCPLNAWSFSWTSTFSILSTTLTPRRRGISAIYRGDDKTGSRRPFGTLRSLVSGPYGQIRSRPFCALRCCKAVITTMLMAPALFFVAKTIMLADIRLN